MNLKEAKNYGPLKAKGRIYCKGDNITFYSNGTCLSGRIREIRHGSIPEHAVLKVFVPKSKRVYKIKLHQIL